MVAEDNWACWGLCLCVYNFLIRFQAQSTWWHFNLMEKAIFGFKLEQPCQIHLVLVWPFLISILVLHLVFFSFLTWYHPPPRHQPDLIWSWQSASFSHSWLKMIHGCSCDHIIMRSHHVGGLLSYTSQAQGWFKLVWVNSNWKWCTTAAAEITLCWWSYTRQGWSNYLP